MTKETIISLISQLCVSENLSYNNNMPVSVSPGIWQFYGTQMNDDCSKRGYCREVRYYAKEVDNKMVLC